MSSIGVIALAIVPILLAVSLHEAAHGLVANWLGDSTAKDLGRLTANPIKHIDPVGTILVPLVLVITVGMPFGWAKPVPVDPRRFKNPLKDMALVALAGPVANLIMAVLWVILLWIMLALLPNSVFSGWFKAMAVFGVQINVVLMVLNLLPVPPLDGGRILTGVLPTHLAMLLIRFERAGMVLIILLLVTGILGTILQPMVSTFQRMLYSFFGIM
ncbi:FIG004556: membrane metalloprotease [hydrothermal vent metagenome]|uniref:FIG004556: membrane metalloprotease n=1 Tax=hydrothermal vent metagenome TaxID=652676 RepID=A0A3B0XFI8_9ZZZZ